MIVAILTSKIKRKLPTHVFLDKDKYNLDEDSVVMLEQIRTIDKWRIGDKITTLDSEKMIEVDNKILKSLGVEFSFIKVEGSDEIITIPKQKLLELGII